MDNNQDVRFLYLRDNKTKRVVTVARKLSEDRKNVVFAFAVNRPTTVVHKMWGPERLGDNFSKALGRKIAFDRLMGGKAGRVFCVPLNNKRPIETVLDFLAYFNGNSEEVPRCVRKIALQEYYNSAYDTANNVTNSVSNTLSSAEEEYQD